MVKKIEFGDFQTPLELAQEVTELLRPIYPSPSAILEPTCGVGSFLRASMETWRGAGKYYGFDVNETYIHSLKKELAVNDNCHIEMSDFFANDWELFFKQSNEKWLIIGNPPWVTNSALGAMESNNLPVKSNFQQHEGFAAKTGKANFDIAEWMLIKLIDSLRGTSACLAMLCKAATARKVLRYFWNKNADIHDTSIHKIDAAKHFGVAVEACLFVTFIGGKRGPKDAKVYSGLSFEDKIGHIGIVNNELIADIDLYNDYKYIDGNNIYGWRSGLKHDAAKIMELKKADNKYVNGLNERVELEDDYVFPLLKSSDIANRRFNVNRYVIVTQQKVGDDTSDISRVAPKTWAYLQQHADKLDARKSIIYKKRSRFSIFGIGDYSFTPWKVVVSGMYKNCAFSVVGEENEKAIMVDDTSYFLPCYSEEEAMLICDLLNSEPCQEFIKSLTFFDAKRPVNIDLLKRINLDSLAKVLGQDSRFEEVFFAKNAWGCIRQEPLLFS